MFFRKVTSRSNGKEYTYVKLIENYREGAKVKQRVIANLGNLEDLTPDKVHGLISGLARICGLEPESENTFETKKVLQFGDVLALQKVWESLGINRIINDLLESEKSSVIPAVVELMVINQVLKPKNKKNLSEWSRTLYLPHLEGKKLNLDHFSRALDTLVTIKEPLEKQLFWALQRLFPLNAGTIYCHLTRGFFERIINESNGQRGGRNFMARSPERKQVDMGILVNEKGIPLGHRVFMGYFTDGDTVPRRINDFMQQFTIDNCIFVGDQHIVTGENLRLLAAYGHQFIAGLELRFSRELGPLAEYLEMPPEMYEVMDEGLLFREIQMGDYRYLLCYNPEKAGEKKFIMESRLNRIEKELIEVQKWVAAKCSFNPRANYYRANNLLKDAFCRRYFDCIYDEKNNTLDYRRKQDVIEREMSLGGKFIIKTNAKNLSSLEIINAYTHYSEAREAFRMIKVNEPAPGENSESRVRGYVLISVLAYLVEKTMENILKHNNVDISAKNALEILEDIKLTVIEMNHKETRYTTPADPIQKEILSALGVTDIPRTLTKGAIL